MDTNNRKLLQHYHQDIVNDLDVSDILDELFAKKAISQNEFDHIYDLTNRIDRTRYLLDTLIQNGTNSSFETFVDTLAKDYSWLSNKLTVENNEQMINDSFEDSLSKGDVPRLPDRHVRRDVEGLVAKALKQLTRHKILALHGMPGSGKTCVAISVLRDYPELITTNFNGVVFWLNFGNCKTDDDIVVQQNILLRKASCMYKTNSLMNSTISISSIGSNIDNQSLSNYDLTSLELRDKLKSQFSEQPLKESLLVLDELNDKKCMEVFDIGCKILVTTRDADVVTNFKPKIITIANDFKEKESLELFASCLDVEVRNLPWQAKKLHELCKGSTFHIALIGAQLAENKERFNHDSKAWTEYLKKLEKKEFLSHFSFTKTQDNPMKTIEVCINSLDKNILPLFKMLTVLPDNVKISAKVLSKLWNKDVSRVEQILKILRSKSLIIEYFIRENKNYMYEIHDLIMNYLRTCTSKDDAMKLHSDFLKSYHYETDTPVVITDDGYIAFYIGYHLLNTNNLNNKWSLFKKLYLDLKFLGNKVRLTGPADVMLDLQKYETYIVSNDLDRNLLHSIKAYLSTHGTDLYRYPFTDIVQSILQHESKGILFSRASEIAQSSCVRNELYFDFLHEQNVEEIKHSTIDVKENITSVCFLGDYVLVGTYSGVIKFFHIPTNKLKKEIQGTDSPITWIGVCPMNIQIIASLNQSGTIKISWVFDDVEQDEDDIIEEEPEEPCNNNYPTHVDIYPRNSAFLNCRWTNDEETLITHTSNKIIFYKINGDMLKVIDSFDRDTEILCCVPSNNDKYVIAATRGSVCNVEMIDVTSHERAVSFEEPYDVLDIITVPGTNKIITLKANEIMEHEYKINTNTIMNNCNTCRFRRIIASKEVKENLSFISIAVNKSGTLLFISTDDIRVLVVDLKTYSYVFDLDNRRGNVKAMAVSEVFGWDDFVPGSDVLLTGTDPTENSAKVWYIDASYISQTAQKNGKVRLTTKFDVSFLKSITPPTPSSSTPNSGSTESTLSTPKRHQSFGNHKDVSKKLLKNTRSLDRHSLKPLNLKGICNNNEGAIQPLLAVVDDKNNIQVMRGRKILTEIITKSEEHITTVKISPCNQHIVYGLRSGNVKKYTLRTKESTIIMDLYSSVQYLNFVNPNLLIVASKNRSLMAYRFTDHGVWKPEMLQRGNTSLGSQELLNDLQGVKKKSSPPDQLSSSNSDTSLSSNDRMFRNGDIRGICKGSAMVNCFWVPEVGLITVEHNATIKLWYRDEHSKMSCVLHARQPRVNINCAAFQNNVLVICDEVNKGFETFELKEGGTQMELHTIQEYKLDIQIVSCTLTADGNILAMGLESGNVVVWNVKSKRLIRSLSHHKSKVNWCSFSPVPTRFNRSAVQSPISPVQSEDGEDEQPPLVLVSMASEIVWWNISLITKMRANDAIWKTRLNVVTPLTSPLDIGSPASNVDRGSNANFFFGDGLCMSQDCWKAIWKGKTCKEGSKRKEILACIKLSGMSAKKLCNDSQFSCFVTVDNPGHIHIMNIMKPNT